jgi:tetratricopeptide (TPR) repeat protein
MAPVVLGLPLAAAVAALLYGWIADGRLPPVVPGVGVAVLLIDLLAAGGIGFPGVAGSLWLLLALGLNVAERGAEDRGAATLPWSAAAAGLVLTLALAVACHNTAYGPVLQSQTAMRQAERDPAHAEKLLLSAAELDPLASEPWEKLASEVFGRWMKDANPDSRVFGRFEQCARTALELAPNSAAAWKAIGDCYLAAGSHLREISEANHREAYHREAYQQQAIQAYREAEQAYRRAVALYPNSATNRAQLAEVLLVLQDQAGFRQQAAVALRLDEATPHGDKKLDDELRKRLLRNLSGP